MKKFDRMINNIHLRFWESGRSVQHLMICILSPLFLFSSCTNGLKTSHKGDDLSQEEKLDAFVSGAKEKCQEKFPMEIDEGMTFTHFDFISGYNYMVYTIECDETIWDIEEMRRNRDEMYENMLQNAGELFTQEVITDFMEVGIKELQYKYVGTSTGKIFVLHIKPSEIYEKSK